MSNTIEIGSAKAISGTIVEGEIIVEKLAGGGNIAIPVTIINGKKSGPCFWINGGIHGDEPEGILTCSLLKQTINPENLSGSIVMTPVMNVPAMEAAERGNPLDTFSYDMNRIYPGKKDGYLSERIAYVHKEWMIQFADMEISIHSGGSHSYLAEAMFAAKDDKTQELARAMGEDWKVCLYSNITSKSPMAVMSENGKPALTVELGGRSSTAPGAFLEVGKKLLKACLNILVHYKMIEGTPHYPHKRYKGFQQALLAPKSGVFLPNPDVKFLTMMKKNDLIATIINYQGNEQCKILAPEDGMFFGLRALPNVTIGDWCCFYAIIEGEW
jgi:predicted deacylase